MTGSGNERSVFGARIRSVRRAADITQERVAEALGVSVATVANWETGETVPNGRLFAPLFNLLQIPSFQWEELVKYAAITKRAGAAEGE